MIDLKNKIYRVAEIKKKDSGYSVDVHIAGLDYGQIGIFDADSINYSSIEDLRDGRCQRLIRLYRKGDVQLIAVDEIVADDRMFVLQYEDRSEVTIARDYVLRTKKAV